MTLEELKQLIDSYASNKEGRQIHGVGLYAELEKIYAERDLAREVLFRADEMRADLEAVCNLDREGACQHYHHCGTAHAYDKVRRTLKSPPPYSEHKAALLDLLAIIHGDGGHHTSEVGVEQSVEDAHQVWCELRLQEMRLVTAEGALKAADEMRDEISSRGAIGPKKTTLESYDAARAILRSEEQEEQIAEDAMREVLR